MSTDTTTPDAKLPRRDWLVIPVICVATIAVVAFATNKVAHRNFTEYENGVDRCKVFVDPVIGIRRASDCTYIDKNLETPAAELRLNDRGYREDTNLQPKAPGTFRVVMVGTSFGWGLGAPKEDTIAGRLPAEIVAHGGRKVELYNESLMGFPGLPQNLPKRFDDILAAQPDLILWQMTRWDIKAIQAGKPDPPDVRSSFSLPPEAMQHVHSAFRSHSPKRILTSVTHLGIAFVKASKNAFLDSNVAFMLRSWLNRSQTEFLASYLTSPDNTVGYLRVHETPTWEQNTALFEPYYRELQAKAAAAHIPLVLVCWPSRAQAYMITSGDWDPAFDPWRLNREIGGAVRHSGGTYLDVFSLLNKQVEPGSGFLPVDGHPSAEGNRMLASMLATALTNGSVPQLSPNYTAPQER